MHAKPTPTRARRAFTLVEALVASTLLGMVVLAVISAVSSSQTLSFEGQKSILAAMAADDLMAELVTMPYGELRIQNGLDQPIGSMATLSGSAYTDTVWPLGRRVEVVEENRVHQDLGVVIRGMKVTVRVRDEARDLVIIETFVPEPTP